MFDHRIALLRGNRGGILPRGRRLGRSIRLRIGLGMARCWGLAALRWSTVFIGIGNIAVTVLGGYIVCYGLGDCEVGSIAASILFVSAASLVRIIAMMRTGILQRDAAQSIIDTSHMTDSIIRLERRLRYQSWLWWCRFGMSVTALQMLFAIYLVYNVAKYITLVHISSPCHAESTGDHRKQKIVLSYSTMACVVPMFQCFVGADVLRWRSFYASHDDIWRTHYQEVFDHGIREALCCLGRIKYMNASEEDEVYSVARLLGDLVSYRASGRGHLELLAGLALLHKHKDDCPSHENLPEAPLELIKDAFTFHKFAEAAYTGPLLDFGRHTVFFSCAWLYRQGILSPWARSRRPLLARDNWWRGHAAAFLNYANILPESLRSGRVGQSKCEAAYFVVALSELKSVIIAVRGTETPEDLITDGLGRECPLTSEDLNSFVSFAENTDNLSSTHYGHSGIVEAARELHFQLEGNCESQPSGILSSLLGPGGECEGYNIRIVGHSLGGAIATLLGLRLYKRYSNLHVYAYGPLPCLDFQLAEACSEFVTCIVHDKEFSARLSVGSIIRLRAAAIKELVQDQTADSTSVLRLARRFLYLNESQRETKNHIYESDSDTCLDDPVSQVFESSSNPPELYLPGRIIHLIPQHKSHANLLWEGWGVADKVQHYRAYLGRREDFKEIVVSPKMFFDHLPWRCHYALRMALAAQTSQDQTELV